MGQDGTGWDKMGQSRGPLFQSSGEAESSREGPGSQQHVDSNITISLCKHTDRSKRGLYDTIPAGLWDRMGT